MASNTQIDVAVIIALSWGLSAAGGALEWGAGSQGSGSLASDPSFAMGLWYDLGQVGALSEPSLTHFWAQKS